MIAPVARRVPQSLSVMAAVSLIAFALFFGRGGTVTFGWWTTSFVTLEGLRALVLPALTLGVIS